jgi:hypothetical protein
MFTHKQLRDSKKDLKELKDLPIEDFVGWDGWERMIDSHIEALQKIEWLENRREEILVESGKRWTKLLKIKDIVGEEL